MDISDIMSGLNFRLDNLTKAREVLIKNRSITDITIVDYDARIDEVESLIEWIASLC